MKKIFSRNVGCNMLSISAVDARKSSCTLFIIFITLSFLSSVANGTQLKPRHIPEKPLSAVLDERHDGNNISVKFSDDLDIGIGPPPTGACCVDMVCVATNTEEECAALGGTWYEGETCPEFECPAGPCEGTIYSNGEPIYDYGSPASQYANDYPFAAGAADDFELSGPANITEIITWITHWNGAQGLGPNLYTGVNVTIYADNTPSGPGGELLDDGTRIEYFPGGIVYTTTVTEFTFYQEVEPCTGDLWRLELPMDISLMGGVVYWLEIQPVMVFSGGGGQSAVSLADMNHGGPAQQIFVAAGIPAWRAVGGNTEACPESPPAITMYDLAFCLYGDQEIPTLSEWGMLILTLLLLAVGTAAVVRRRKKVVSKVG